VRLMGREIRYFPTRTHFKVNVFSISRNNLVDAFVLRVMYMFHALDTLLGNVGKFLPDNTASHRRIL